MIIGLGVDIIEIARIKKVYNKFPWKFVNKLFSDREQKKLMTLHNPNEYISGRFAAKEAVAKAFGTGIGQVRWKDIEILTADEGYPVVNLHGEALNKAEELGVTKVYLSISHSKTSAVANAILWSD
ncbi:holo-ACP synthase [Natranaerobius thermophilus]|uniref:Holo-[acyl-carrier-protein] synthase n=1 Tax=Natranaerobius thermophilus (strain ATCC BAA-1301 / DSM 18059 / JW/NM-WN-LF) TaxID=457570 RepID=ACPS_NATTJ|nr:holo-ACP synthase [Natranaerobius thermophilus]B2A4X6.1 RecName: Full=Holo-[acyl-carrier-protein] synthase; Short=Holo-ACP synthase; AltName: Full=4'-phosphopantetheinyl transferase AcpS [Natranaerobius thermophilus JW/NM-WN-LF]ACB83898.1 holo-acyl-carrier-protein synthase [Natranaerobius thermophilus JW/NM-WN-LF]